MHLTVRKRLSCDNGGKKDMVHGKIPPLNPNNLWQCRGHQVVAQNPKKDEKNKPVEGGLITQPIKSRLAVTFSSHE